MWPDSKNPKKPDWKALKEHFHREGHINKEDVLKLVTEVNRILKAEGNLLYIYDPITVVGDIHGQYYDLMKILDVGGAPDSTKYLFLGDFVDRGSFSVEVILLIFALKINYPKTVNIIRGNHECRQMTSFFNFRNECIYKYDQEIYDVFMDSFDHIPLSCERSSISTIQGKDTSNYTAGSMTERCFNVLTFLWKIIFLGF